MRSRNFYKHEDCIDTFVECLKVQYSDEERVKVKVSWWIQGATHSWPVGLVEVIEIPKRIFHKWHYHPSPV